MVRTKGASFKWKYGFGTVSIFDGKPYVTVWFADQERTVPVLRKKSPRSKGGFSYVAYIPGKDGEHNRTLSVPKSCLVYALQEVSA